MRGEPPRYPPAKIVKPRKPKHTHRPLIVVAEDECLVERTGLVFPAESLPTILRCEPSSLIACQGFGEHLERLERVFRDDTRFTFSMSEQRRMGSRKSFTLPVATVGFVGWMADPNAPKARRYTHYHYVLDPVAFVNRSIDGIDGLKPEPLNGSRLTKLFEWAKEVREWCSINQLEVKRSSGGVVAQLLRDPRIYPQPRRKSPSVLNRTVRSQLPGNYYLLRGERNREYSAYYLDIEAAHHRIAATIDFPDVNTLHGYGYWSTGDRIFAPPTSDILHRPGIFKLRVTVPFIPDARFPPPWARVGGTRDIWIYSNELELIHKHGMNIQGIIAAIVSDGCEPKGTGVKAYGKFALKQIRTYPEWKPWLKPVLHSTHGMLAARPTQFEIGYYRASRGTLRDFHMGRHTFRVTTVSTRKPVESTIANVIHRGMIEAGLRKEVLWMADYLQNVEGLEVLAIYGDAVFIRDKGREPFILPPGWDWRERCDPISWEDETHFRSPQLTRLPGVPRDRREAERLDKLIWRDAVIQSAYKPLSPRRDHASRQT